MMNDGHSGIENRQVNQGGSGNFQLILSYLKQGDGRGEFVIHATSNTSYSSGLQPLEFLQLIGFYPYSGSCPFHRNNCYYRAIATLRKDTRGFDHHQQVQLIHAGFTAFTNKIGELFELRQRENTILQQVGLDPAHRYVFGKPLEIEITESDIPLWVNEVKFSHLIELEKQRDTILGEIKRLNSFLPLLYGTGDSLEETVVKTLQLFGLEAERTQKGFTADILAQTSDGKMKFGFEVTGTSDSIKKQSKKLTQVLEFERIKENNEKTVLVATTHNSTPISERKGLEDFTQPVLDFLGRHPILLMTGWDLYRLVRDVLDDSRGKEQILNVLYTTNGKFEYERI
jgi:hypothetical protein